MLRILTAPELDRRPGLRDAMLRDRATQFRDRLGWPVSVDDRGRERDEYDHAGALYVIVQGADGRHEGSARFLPTVGPHMAADHFAHLIGGPLRSPLIWEVTRFCLAPGAGRHVAPLLMLGGAEVMRALSLTHLLGVFDLAMLRVYAGIGAMPEVLGTQGTIGAGLWAEGAEARARLLRRARLRPEALPEVIDAPALAAESVAFPTVAPVMVPALQPVMARAA
jgi:acyl homoserine lactone synthase